MPQKKMGSHYSFGTKSKSSLNVVVIAQRVAMPGLSMRRSLMLCSGMREWSSDRHSNLFTPIYILQ